MPMDIESCRAYCLSKPMATEDFPFDESTLVLRVKGKIFACLPLDKPTMVVLKCDPEYAVELRDHYIAIEGAWHWNKKYWNQISFDGDVQDDLLCDLIDHSYEQVVRKLPKKDRLELELWNKDFSS